MANEVQTAFDAAVPRALAEAAQRAAVELQAAAPRASGELASSVRAVQDTVRMEDHGYFINRRGRHQGWIERATGGEVV